MIQRIQTVYLLIIAALTVAIIFLPLAVIQSGDQLFRFDATGVTSALGENAEIIYPTWGLFALSAITAIIALVTIFLFNKRVLQIRLCIFNAFLMIGFYGLFAFMYSEFKGALDADVSTSFKFALSFPLISLILDYLAIRNIGADEALVRSLDRLR